MSLPRPLLELTRGRVVESAHFGSIAVVDSKGRLLHAWGDPQTDAFLRSAAKPFKSKNRLERGGA
jgi:L-asparaginase II